MQNTDDLSAPHHENKRNQTQPMTKRRKAITGLILFALLAGVIVASLWLGKSPLAAEDPAAVDLDRLIDFAQRCNDCYHDHDTFKSEYGPQVELGEFPVSGLRIYLDAAPGSGPQWVILRGTANLPDVIEDLEFAGEDEHELGIQVHAGFNKSLQECLPWVIQWLDPDRPVLVTGHSLGGAVAVLLMATLEQRGFKDVSGVTFDHDMTKGYLPALKRARELGHIVHANHESSAGVKPNVTPKTS